MSTTDLNNLTKVDHQLLISDPKTKALVIDYIACHQTNVTTDSWYADCLETQEDYPYSADELEKFLLTINH